MIFSLIRTFSIGLRTASSLEPFRMISGTGPERGKDAEADVELDVGQGAREVDQHRRQLRGPERNWQGQPQPPVTAELPRTEASSAAKSSRTNIRSPSRRSMARPQQPHASRRTRSPCRLLRGDPPAVIVPPAHRCIVARNKATITGCCHERA